MITSGRHFQVGQCYLEKKSLKIIDLLENEFMPICHLKVLLISGYNLCDFSIFFAKNFKDLSWYCRLWHSKILSGKHASLLIVIRIFGICIVSLFLCSTLRQSGKWIMSIIFPNITVFLFYSCYDLKQLKSVLLFFLPD